MEYLKPALTILIPLLIGFGQILKTKAKVNTKFIPLILLLIGFVFACVYGFITSEQTGWRFWVDSIVITGLCHGCVAAFCAMGIFDLGKSAVRKVEA